MSDPLNQLPTDPEWLRKIDELTKAAARDLGCMVMLLAVQEQGKVCLSIEGIPETGELADMAKDPPGMMLTVAKAMFLQDQLGLHKGPKS